MVGGVVDLVSPTRELLREGKITKISARSSDHQERHLFVFNDLVLVCSQRLMSNRVVSGPCYRVRARLDLDGMLVQDGDNLETPNSFYIKNTGRSIELCAASVLSYLSALSLYGFPSPPRPTLPPKRELGIRQLFRTTRNAVS